MLLITHLVERGADMSIKGGGGGGGGEVRGAWEIGEEMGMGRRDEIWR